MRKPPFLMFLIAASLFQPGCERDTPSETPTPAIAEALPEAFAEALPDDLKVALSTVIPDQAPSYTLERLAACPLRYEFVADINIISPEEFSPVGRAIDLKSTYEGAFTASVEDQQLSLRSGTIDRFEYVEDERVRHPGIAADVLAPVLLNVESSQLIEHDGPSTLWSAMGEFPGLTIFFPALPESAQVGSTASWTPRIHQRGSSIGVETRRGQARAPEGFTAPKAQGTTHEASVKLERWLSLGDSQAALLKADWSTGPYEEYMRTRDGASPEPVHLTLTQNDTYSGTYVVSEAGRVLFSSVQSTREQHITGTGGFPEQHVIITLSAQMNLVQGCDDPVLSSAAESPDLEIDEATRVVNRFIAAVKSNDLAALNALLSPALRQKPGSQEILDTLRDHLDTHGPDALGHPELPIDLADFDQGQRVELAGPSTLLLGQENNVLVTVYYTEPIEGEMRIIGMGADTSARDMHWNVLEITEKRFFRQATP